MRSIQILLLSLMSIQVSFGQEIDTLKLDAYFTLLEANDKFMGSVAILRDGQLVYDVQVGFLDIDTQKRPDANSKYRVGSISKTFTAVMVFKAIEEGLIDLDGTIEGFFPSVPNADRIRISDLLAHSSGVHNFTDDVEEYLAYYTGPKSRDEMVEIIAKGGSDFEPDSKHAYSNSNYVLLSYILEEVYEKPYAQIVSDGIVTPVGLTGTYFGGRIDPVDNESYSYGYTGKWAKNDETDLSVAMGAGGMVSTPTDLVLFADALFGNKLVTESSVERMKTTEDSFGMGLFKIPFGDKTAFGHSGGIDGFHSMLVYFIDDKSAFAITSNGNNYEMNSITLALESALFNKPLTVPVFSAYEPRAKDLRRYEGVYSNDTFPLKVEVSRSGKSLTAQATGQSSFELEATEKGVFRFDPAGIVLTFDADKEQMVIDQGGVRNVLVKE